MAKGNTPIEKAHSRSIKRSKASNKIHQSPKTVPVPLEALELVVERAHREMARTQEEMEAFDLVCDRLAIYRRVHR